ncbi:MAG: SCO family protein [Bacteroidia bacterium]
MSSPQKKSFLNFAVLAILIGFVLFAIIGIVGTTVFHLGRSKHLLPVYGEEYDASNNVTGYHKVHDFKMTDQEGHTVTRNTFKNKIFVVNFFFATCQGICKQMNHQLERATKNFTGNPYVKFVSYTVDPMHDSIPVLADYAKQHDAVPGQWYFLTGDKKEINRLACKSYLDVGGECQGEAFVHTQNMALVDTAGHLRGFYSGTDSADVNRLIADINLLMKEEGFAKE